jgi:hypothetical protein
MPLACKHGMGVVYGAPISVGEKKEHPTDEEVAALMAKYTAAVVELFNTHKAEFGCVWWPRPVLPRPCGGLPAHAPPAQVWPRHGLGALPPPPSNTHTRAHTCIHAMHAHATHAHTHTFTIPTDHYTPTTHSTPSR